MKRLLLFVVFLFGALFGNGQPFPTDNLQLWLLADSVELDESGRVLRWYDLSPNKYEIVQTDASARPIVSDNALNKQPALIFNGTSTFLTGGDILDLGTNGWTWFVVGKYNNGGQTGVNSPIFLGKYDRYIEWASQPLWTLGKEIWEVFWNDGQQKVINFSSNVTSNLFSIFSYEILDRENSTNTIFKNNFLSASNSYGGDFGTYDNNLSFKIGQSVVSTSAPNGNFLNGQITEIIAFNTIDADLRNMVHNYLVERYFPEHIGPVIFHNPDIHVFYGFADTIISTVYNSNLMYQWSTGEKGSVIHVNKSGEYRVNVTNTFGYTSSDTINVYYPEPAQLRDTTICAGDTIVWNTALNGPYSYLWSDGSTENFLEITAGGEYWVVITDSLGYSWKSDTIMIAVDDYPQTTLFTDEADSHTIDTALCSGNALGLATNADVTTSYQWSTDATSTRIALTQSGDYTLVSANARGCRATNTAHVTIKGEAPRIGFDVCGFCLGDTTAFNGLASSEQGIESYLWIIDKIDSIGGQSFRRHFAEARRHEAKIIVTSNNTCVNDSTFTINIKEIPHADFSFTPVCAGVPIDLLNTSHIPDTCAAAQYQWSADGQTLGTDENLTFTFGGSMPVTYSLTLDNGCADDTTIIVSVRDEYTAPKYVSCVSPINRAIVNGDSINFLWNPDNDILYYELITSSYPNFSDADTVICKINNATLPANAFTNTTYWKVKSFNHCMVTTESSSYMFRKVAGVYSDFSIDTSLQLWLRADSVEMDENGRVSQWYDLSPNQYEIVQTDASARPIVSDNALNKQPALIFNGTSTFLTGGDILDLGTNGWTWFVVGKYNNGGQTGVNSPIFLGKYDRYIEWASQPLWTLGKEIWEVFWNDGQQKVINFSSNVTSNLFSIFSYEILDRENSTNTIFKNNFLSASNSYGGDFGTYDNNLSFKIGQSVVSTSAPNGNFLNGQITEIIAFNTIDADLRNMVHNYLVERYFPEHIGPFVLPSLDIHSYSFADTAITTAYNPNFVSYLWSTGETDSIIHVNKSGTYWVTVTNAFGYSSSDTINVYYPEPAQLRDTTICAGGTVVWDTGLGNGYSFLWSDGSTESSLEITADGEYYVTITDSLGHFWKSDTITVEVDSFPITARLEGDQINSCIGNNIYLQSGYEEAVSYLWSNGSTADHLAVTEPGQYWVKMTDRLGCKAADTAYVSVLGIAPTPDFTHSALCATREITFRDSSQAKENSHITSYLWQFGDGGTATTANATHTYARSGSYNLLLTIAASNGCSNQKRQKIVIDSLPTANFIPVRACSHTDVQFTDLSSTPVSYLTEWQWTMNDSVFAERHPRTTFATHGDAPVQLVVTTAHGCTDTLRRTINIMQGPDVEFTFSAPCVNKPIYFTNNTVTTLGLTTSYTWTTDTVVFSQQRSPMIEYADTGTHTITLNVKQLANGCSATVSKTVIVKNNPKPGISADSFCEGKAASLRGVNREPQSPSGEWLWTIDTLPKISGQTISPVFAQSGRHKARLTIVDGNGCTAFYDTTINVLATPTAAFVARSTRGPVPFEAEFVNKSRNASSYEWNFGDGRTSTDTDACHTYNIDGEFTVALTASNGNCADTAVRTVSAIVPQTNLRMLSATATTDNGTISIEAVVANLSNFDVTDIGLAWRDNLGHTVSEVSADTIKQNKILRYRFKASIGEPNPSLLQYICVEAQPGTAFADDDPDDNEFCIILNNSEFTACLPKPNPADKELNISYILPDDDNVRIELFNSGGIVAATLYDGPATAGFNSHNFDIQRFKAGVYFYKITTSQASKTQTVIISR